MHQTSREKNPSVTIECTEKNTDIWIYVSICVTFVFFVLVVWSSKNKRATTKIQSIPKFHSLNKWDALLYIPRHWFPPEFPITRSVSRAVAQVCYSAKSNNNCDRFIFILFSKTAIAFITQKLPHLCVTQCILVPWRKPKENRRRRFGREESRRRVSMQSMWDEHWTWMR